MSKQIRHRKSASKIAAALCLISSGAATAGEIAPTLVKTTTPIRVRSAAVHPNRPSRQVAAVVPVQREQTQRDQNVAIQSNPNVDQSFQANAELRKLLEPDSSISLNPHMSPGEMGVPRTNRFVELQSDDTTDRTRSSSTTRSAAVLQRSQRRYGTIQKNPLVVDTPPTLRRFDLDEVPLVLPATVPGDSPADYLVAREQPLPARPVEDLDQTLDMLSIQSGTPSEIRGAARDVGFGMLAIDQIGQHLSDLASDDIAMPSPSVQRYSTDLVLPNGLAAGLLSSEMDDSLRHQLSAVESTSLVEGDVPPLPSTLPSTLPSPHHTAIGVRPGRTVANRTPASRVHASNMPGRNVSDRVSVEPPEAISISQALDAASAEITATGRESAGQSNLPSPFRPNPSAQTAMEVDELIAASTRNEKKNTVQPKPDPSDAKPSLVQRFSSWSKGLSNKSHSSNQPSSSKSVSVRIAEKPVDNSASGMPKKRSGGILGQWLKTR